ncbi:hypothetical protein L602_001300000670 [Cupriavidus gilardii J11]|uniref:Uncharacterized protein n=1 Tax=Cupriavidus gilardii J11 TaxID=936133 RepID=A0A562BU32_9BURK|nr:hypothetical protein [Cupriavidus gilardii]TWG88310.1 hypothetical protein L602_001300000670 [Cupriavidus gilardii J11]
MSVDDGQLPHIPARIAFQHLRHGGAGVETFAELVQRLHRKIWIDPGLRGHRADVCAQVRAMAPTAGTAVLTAIPSSPVRSQRATMENVME